MKGVILAGGTGTRLRPVTLAINKHLLPIFDRPMIHYPIQCLLNAGIEDILIVTGAAHAEAFKAVVGNGESLGVRRLTYAYQTSPAGIADALSLAEGFADGQKICVLLGDNIIEGSILPTVSAFDQQSSGARVLLHEAEDLMRFGVPRFDEAGTIAEIIEKPADPPSQYAVIGIYFYDSSVFDICRSLRPSRRGEMEIADVNNVYAARGDLSYEVLPGGWADVGTFQGMYHATRLVAKRGANRSHEVAKP